MCAASACILRIVEILRVSGSTRGKLTKRDIFYMDTSLFGRQTTVDSIIGSLARACSIPRDELGATASPRGLAYGCLRWGGVPFDETVQLARMPEPGAYREGELLLPRTVLIVEKEAVFSSLVRAYKEHLDPSLLLVTGRGFPDLSTGKFVHWLSTRRKHPPVHILVDFDVYGLDIALCYRQGPRRLPADQPTSCCPQLRLAGLTSQQIDRHCHRFCQPAALAPRSNRRPLTPIELRRIDCLIKRAHDAGWAELAKAADDMKQMGYSTELESIYGQDPLLLVKFIQTVLHQ